MKKILPLLVFAIPFSLYSQQWQGKWNGVVSIGEQNFRLSYLLNQEGDHWVADMMSPDQSDNQFRCDRVHLSSDSVVFEASQMGIAFRGKFNDSHTEISGLVEQGDSKYPLILSKKEIRKSIKPRSQNPIEPFPYKVEEVKFSNTKAGIELSGTLTYPEGKGPFAAVILVSGSGPQDRDETILDHRPFWVIADYLSRQGYVVLRYDDRGVFQSGGNFQTATSLDFADDALAAIEFLESKNFVDKTKTGIIGHSEGGLVAPIAAAQSDKVDFIISLAGTGVSGREILHLQTIDIQSMEGMSKESAEADARKNDDIFNILDHYPDSTAAAKAILHYIDSTKKDLSGTIPDYENYKAYHNTFFNTQWMRTFGSYDSAQAWSKVKCPVLALNGDKDLQVNAYINLNAIAAALEKGGNYNYKTVTFQGLNHLFQPTLYGRVSEYGEIETTIDVQILEEMSSWMGTILQGQ